jgi:hypothetical protein
MVLEACCYHVKRAEIFSLAWQVGINRLKRVRDAAIFCEEDHLAF